MRTNPVLDSLGAHPIAAIQDRARAMRDAGIPLVDFSIGDPREPTPPAIREALLGAVPEVSQYPTTRGLTTLREAVAGYVGRRFGVEVDPESQVLPTTGSKEAIFSTALAFVDRARGDRVVFPTPGYPVYERGARLAGAVAHPVRLDGDFVFRAGMVDEAVWSETALVWICTPHNPAGSVMSRSDLEELAGVAEANDVLVCSDECYADLYDGDPPPSALEVAGPGSRGVLSYLSCSKRSGMTGYRAGAIVGDAEAIEALRRLRTATGTAPPEFTQAAATAAWSDDVHATERRALFAKKRALLRKAFEKVGLEVVASDAGLYLWVRVPDDLDAAARLLEWRIVVSPGRAFGPGGEGYLRLALVPALEECEQAAQEVIRCLSGS
jgi:succinyldiaminopimelate transaminase